MPVGPKMPKMVSWPQSTCNFSRQTSGFNGSSIWRGPPGSAPYQAKYIPPKQAKNR